MKKLESLENSNVEKLNSTEMGSLVAGRCTDNVATGGDGGSLSSDNEAHHYDDGGNYTGMTLTNYYDS
ncbi:MAG: hypothetical protein H6586_04950 [Flavobacteriales bacterium]|nr:hypothetical protein [Flavobacteriales bacterium]